jgi:hypothetical protein
MALAWLKEVKHRQQRARKNHVISSPFHQQRFIWKEGGLCAPEL